MINQTYNYFYNGQAISKSRFENAAPENWENGIDENGEYSFGYYRAIQRD